MSNMATMVDRRSAEDLISPDAVRDMRLLLALMQDHVPKAEGKLHIDNEGDLGSFKVNWFVNGRYENVLGSFNAEEALDVSGTAAKNILAVGLYEYFRTVQPEMADSSTPLAYDIAFRLTAPTPLRSAKLIAQVTVINSATGAKMRQYNLSEDLDDFYDQNSY